MPDKSTVKIDGEDKRQFLRLALIACQQTGFLEKDETDLHNDRLLNLYRQWGGDSWLQNWKNRNSPFAAEEAAVNFTDWLKVKAGEKATRVISREIEIDRISVTIEMTLGEKSRVQFTAEGKLPENPDKDEMQYFYGRLFSQAFQGYYEIREHPPTLDIKRPYQPTTGASVNTFTFTSIRTASDGGKRSFFVKGDRFVKYGVRVFPDVLSKAGIDPASIDGEKFIAGTATYTVKGNGEPDLVIGLSIGVTQL